MKEFKDIEINGNVVRFLHVRKGEENKDIVKEGGDRNGTNTISTERHR